MGVVCGLVFRSRLGGIAVTLGLVPTEKPRRKDEADSEDKENASESMAQKNFREDLEDLTAADEECDKLENENWVPRLDKKHWSEVHTMPGSPWSFDRCNTLADALERVWRPPLGPELEKAFDALKARVANLHVAKVKLPLVKELHYVLVYQLITGAELFGGAPTELSFGVDLGVGPGMEQDEDDFSGLRQRKGLHKQAQKTAGAPDVPDDLLLPCLAPFYRIHDGFGVLNSFKHLAVLCTSPEDYVSGSCYYVYPIRALERVKTQPHLVIFARVDKACVVGADVTKEHVQKVYYIDKGHDMDEDMEEPISFVADTVCNVAGQRVVPPSYMGGPSLLFPS